MSEIEDFFDGKEVLITGATGFLGKVLLEKLLRCCPEVKRIYLLIRETKGKTIFEKLEKTFKLELFDLVREECPAVFDKVTAIYGDISLPGLGLGVEDRNTLVESVSVIFHSAATIKFNEPLRISTRLNLMGTQSIFELAKEMKCLKSLVHVSTAYSNFHRVEPIQEIVYPALISPQRLLDILDTFDDSVIEKISGNLLGKNPNTYTFTKAVTEMYIDSAASTCKFPIAIVRPSIITAVWKTPIQGWLDNHNGATGAFYAAAQGALKTVKIMKDAKADLVPVDVVANCLIAVANENANTYECLDNRVKVYNCTSGTFKPVTWDSMTHMMQSSCLRFPSEKAFRYPQYLITESYLANMLTRLVYHHCVAIAMDALALITFNKPKYVSFYSKFHLALESIREFTLNSWEFQSSNVKSMTSRMTPQDQQVFYLDMENINWPEYIDHYGLGIRKYLGKEDPATLELATKRLKTLKFKDELYHGIVGVSCLCLVLFQSKKAKNLILLLISLVFKYFGTFLPSLRN